MEPTEPGLSPGLPGDPAAPVHPYEPQADASVSASQARGRPQVWSGARFPPEPTSPRDVGLGHQEAWLQTPLGDVGSIPMGFRLGFTTQPPQRRPLHVGRPPGREPFWAPVHLHTQHTKHRQSARRGPGSSPRGDRPEAVSPAARYRPHPQDAAS